MVEDQPHFFMSESDALIGILSVLRILINPSFGVVDYLVREDAMSFAREVSRGAEDGVEKSSLVESRVIFMVVIAKEL